MPTFSISDNPFFVSWNRSTRLKGGYWTGTFVLEGSLNRLLPYYYNWLSGVVYETLGGLPTWRGFINEIDIETENGVIRRKSLETTYNYIRYSYTNDAGEVITGTPVSDANSISIYGRKEYRINSDNFTSGEASALANVFLKQNAFPYSRPLTITIPDSLEQNRPLQSAILTCSVAGMAFTMNWRYVTAGDGTQGNISTYISEIISSDIEYLTAGTIATNTLQTVKTTDGNTRVWDHIISLIERGDASNNPYSLSLDNLDRISYGVLSNTPKYYYQNGKIRTAALSTGSISGWTVQPGVFRDIDYSANLSLPSTSWLSKDNDLLVEEVEMSTDSGLMLKTIIYDESEIMEARFDYDRETSEEKTTKKKKKQGRFKWGILAGEWEKWKPEARRAHKAKWKKMTVAERWNFKINRYPWLTMSEKEREKSKKEQKKNP